MDLGNFGAEFQRALTELHGLREASSIRQRNGKIRQRDRRLRCELKRLPILCDGLRETAHLPELVAEVVMGSRIRRVYLHGVSEMTFRVDEPIEIGECHA